MIKAIKLLSPNDTGGNGTPTPAPAAEPPAAAKVVASGKTERELVLERENAKLKKAITQTAASKRKAEIEAAHLANERDKLKGIPPTPQPSPKEKFTWMGFGNA